VSIQAGPVADPSRGALTGQTSSLVSESGKRRKERDKKGWGKNLEDKVFPGDWLKR
jgi:hypothetical protein